LGEYVLENMQDVGTVFPRIRHISFRGRTPDNISLNAFDSRNFRDQEFTCLEDIYFYANDIATTLSLTLIGKFVSLDSIGFGQCEMDTLAFSGENLLAIERLTILECRNLADVTGIWDGGNPILDRNSFKKLTVEEAPLLNIANLNTWLTSHATKCVITRLNQIRLNQVVDFVCQNNGRIITVCTERRDLKPGDLNALTDVDTATIGTPPVANIPFRRNTQHPWNVNVNNWFGFPVVALEFEGSGNVADAAVISRQNATATDAINTENISNFQMNIKCRDPLEKITFNDAPWEPVAFALTKENPLFAVEFADLNAIPGELFLKEIPCMEGAANPVAPEPHGLKVILGGNSEAVSLWRKGGVGHYLAVGKSRDVSGLKLAGWQEVRKEEINGFEGGILFRRENILPATVP
jgi:hypothetical protein